MAQHILLALLEQPEGVILQILERLEVDTEAIKTRLDDALKASPRTPMYASASPMQVYITPARQAPAGHGQRRSAKTQGRVRLDGAHLPRHC